MSGNAADIAIIGGGIIGCALAYDLARGGARVTLFDRRDLAREASWASAGIISAPLPGAGDILPIALRSYLRYPELIAEIEERAGFRTGWHVTGKTILATEAEAASARELVDWSREQGIEADWLDRDALRKHEPAVAERFVGGLYQPQIASVMLDRVARALALAAEQLGATIRPHEAVMDIDIHDGRAVALRTLHERVPTGQVIVAAGAWSRMFGDALDLQIPTVPVRGQMMAVAGVSPGINTLLAYDGVYVVPRADGTVAVGATEEPESGFDVAVTPAGISWLTEKAAAIAPPVARGKLVSTWAGLRPGTTHGRPIIGPVPHLDNVWIVTGHFRSGALLAAGTSEIVAESLLGGALDERLKPFLPGSA